MDQSNECGSGKAMASKEITKSMLMKYFLETHHTIMQSIHRFYQFKRELEDEVAKLAPVKPGDYIMATEFDHNGKLMMVTKVHSNIYAKGKSYWIAYGLIDGVNRPIHATAHIPMTTQKDPDSCQTPTT